MTVAVFVSLWGGSGLAQETKPAVGSETVWKLPRPQVASKPVLKILEMRRSQREFSPEPLPDGVLAELLWAATGVNRPDTGKRTNPTAMNCQEIDVYVALAKGVYRYDHKAGDLVLVVAEDLRERTGGQPFVKDAPVNLVFVADLSRVKSPRGPVDRARAETYAAMDAAFVSQNVYFYCAAEGLATVVRGWFDKEALGAALKLGPDQKVVLTQTVGYPVKGGK
ncbi:MAG: SagB/ThcOx family dehydrogenase [Acidobacteria bacterium]|nr:SagB/ThcOx family dehydrogenase [Acidobacteriota bacterium]